MIISVPLEKKAVSKFIIMNKGIAKEEQTARKKLPHRRLIRLYHTDTEKNIAYLPLGGNGDILPLFTEKSLSTTLTYNKPQIKENSEMFKNIQEEQDYVLGKIKEQSSGLIVMKTGRGKSHVIMRTTEFFQAKTLIVCHSVQTLIEMKESFERFTTSKEDIVGVYYGSKKEIKDITITTKKSLCENSELFCGKFSVVLIDEADTGLSWDNTEKKKTKKNIGMISTLCLIDCERIYGLTGTPHRADMDSGDLELLYGKIIELKGQKNNGYNYVPEIQQYVYVSQCAFSYENVEEARQVIINDMTRLELQFSLIVSTYNNDSFRYGIIMLDRVALEANPYYEQLKELHPELNIELITGKTKPKDDAAAIQRLKDAGKGLIVCTKQKMGRGVDIPMLDAVFILFPGKLPSSVIQAVGRILRIDGDKQPIIYDRHDNYGMFKQQGRIRIASYKKEYISPKISIYNIKPVTNDEY